MEGSVALKRQRAPPIVGSAMWVYIATGSMVVPAIHGCTSPPIECNVSRVNDQLFLPVGAVTTQ